MNIDEMADSTTNIKDQFLYTGFVDQDLENETGLGTYDFGQTLVMLAPMGTFQGYSDGKAIDEIVDEQALDAIVDEYQSNPNERLLDIDHKSMRVPEDRDTTAAGWIYDITAVKSLGVMNGLYGKVKWTDVGRKLVESRQYRFISPVFSIDESGRPTKLINAALTNRPAMATINPILNTDPETKQDEIDMTKEEVVELIKTTLSEMNKAEEKPAEDDVENTCEKQAENECATEDVKFEEQTEEKPVENEDVKVEEEKVDEDVKVDEKKVDEDEVIKEEVLNTAPTIGVDINTGNKWKNLHGEEFFKYISEHKNELM